MKAAAEGPMKGILQYQEDPIVSTDIIGNTALLDLRPGAHHGEGDGWSRSISWYDNEWGYSCRIVDLIEMVL